MKRYPVVLGVTAAGLAGVLGFHSHSGTVAIGGTSLGAGNAPSSNHSSHTGPSNTRTPATTPTTSPSSTGASGSTTAATGRLEQYGYGQLSVRVTMSGGKITNVAVATLQTAESYSQQLAAQVIPILQREVLSAQSAQINGLSGATYTSEAYAYSVQSALDKLPK
ncbi:MAG TPA: FMN-binding protein [Acidimicrobiales bacterium]|nr:FMN-binding protein [Acidimicrobiales bacterium]